MRIKKRTIADEQNIIRYAKEHYEYDDTCGLVISKRKGSFLRRNDSGTTNYRQYYLKINGRRFKLHCHTLTWVLCKGRFPVGQIDHIDGNIDNNHIENLRECSPRDNNLNMEHPWIPNPDTGIAGVVIGKGGYQCRVNGDKLYFSNPYQAFFYATLCGKRYLPN